MNTKSVKMQETLKLSKAKKNQDSKHDSLKNMLWWLSGIAVLALVVLGELMLWSQYGILWRGLAVSTGLVLTLVLWRNTELGHKAANYWGQVLIELHKVVWPTTKETWQFSFLVIILASILGVIIWLLDGIFVRLVAWLLAL